MKGKVLKAELLDGENKDLPRVEKLKSFMHKHKTKIIAAVGTVVVLIGAKIVIDRSSECNFDIDESTYFEVGTCPHCGNEMHRRYSYSAWWCDSCHEGPYTEYDDDDQDETLSVYEAADIWMSNGKDEDYMFGYTWEELEEASE